MKLHLIVGGCYFGDRQTLSPGLAAEPLWNVRAQCWALSAIPHCLDRITFALTGGPHRPASLDIPDRLGGTPVEVIETDGAHWSYGAWIAAWRRVRGEYDCTLITEDDYVFVMPYFDAILARLLGHAEHRYLCGHVDECDGMEIAAVSNGILTESALASAFDAADYALPGEKGPEYQREFSRRLIETGTTIDDWRAHFRTPYWHPHGLIEFGDADKPVLSMPVQQWIP